MAITTSIKQQSTKCGTKRNGGDDNGDGDGDGDGNGDGNGDGDGDGDGKSKQWQQWRQHGVAACGGARKQQRAECHRCVVLGCTLNVCYTWHRMQYSRVLPFGIPAGIPDSVRFRNKLILSWNDLILTCVPRNQT